MPPQNIGLLKKRLSPFFLGTALSASLFSVSCRPTPEAGAAPPGTPVKVERLESDTVRESTTFVGTLEAVEIVEVRAEASGRIEDIFIESGQSVGAGQFLMVLKPDQSTPQYEGDLAGVDVAISSRENAVKQLDIAIAQRDTAKSEVDLGLVNIARARELTEKGAIAQFQFDQAKQELTALQNKLIAADEQVSAANIAITQADDSIRQAQAQADSSFVNLQSKEVVSPISGIVGNLGVKRGDYIGTGDVVAKVTQTENLFLNIEVPSNKSSQLKQGLTVQLIDPTTKEQLTTGTISFVSPTVNPEGQTILAKALFNNVGRKLRDSQYVEARLVWKTEPGVLIPTTAIIRSGSKNFIYVVSQEPNEAGQDFVNLRPVELGAIQGDRYRVVSGLEEGDRIAISNILKLGDGAPIVPDTSASETNNANPEVESEANADSEEEADEKAKPDSD